MASLLKRFGSEVKVKVKDQLAGPRTDDFSKAPADLLFTKTDPALDGDDCLHDCESCTVKYPRKWSIDEDEPMYGHINGWNTHMIVATGKTDWVRDVSDEKGSVMEAVRDSKIQPSNGKMMLSASNLPLPHNATDHSDGTTVLILPSFNFIDNVTPASVPSLIKSAINISSTNTTPLSLSPSQLFTLPPPLTQRPCNHKALILLCSQGTRDARCGQSAPLLRKELERHLRPLGMYRDLDDHRPGGVGIYFISHVGGHKFAANVMVYRRAEVQSDGQETNGEGKVEGTLGEASQCIWLGRVRPEDCEHIVRFTVGMGKVVKPGSQLRGGFDREKRLTSW